MGAQGGANLLPYSMRDDYANSDRDTGFGALGWMLDAVRFDGTKTATDSHLDEGP